MRGRAASIFPVSAADKGLAVEEEASLRTLGRDWQGEDIEVSWVKLNQAKAPTSSTGTRPMNRVRLVIFPRRLLL